MSEVLTTTPQAFKPKRVSEGTLWLAKQSVVGKRVLVSTHPCPVGGRAEVLVTEIDPHGLGLWYRAVYPGGKTYTFSSVQMTDVHKVPGIRR